MEEKEIISKAMSALAKRTHKAKIAKHGKEAVWLQLSRAGKKGQKAMRKVMKNKAFQEGKAPVKPLDKE